MGLSKKYSRSDLIATIGDQNIFEHYFEQEISLNKCYQSVFREDNNFSTGFYLSKNDHLVYNDFSTSEKLDCVAFVAKKFGVSYYRATDIIAIDFDLMAGTKSSNRQAVIIKRKPLNKQERIIQITAAKYTEKHLDFWNQFAITQQELKDNDVYAVNSLCINDYIIPSEEGSLRFAYLVKRGENSYLKIYSPYDKQYKWVSSCPIDALFGFDELPYKSNTLWICKSQKERLICKKFFTDVIAIQAENKSSINDDDFKYLKTKYENIIYFGDNDVPGLRFCDYIKTTYDMDVNHFPENFLTKFKVKDIGDFVSLWGIENLEKWLNINKLL